MVRSTIKVMESEGYYISFLNPSKSRTATTKEVFMKKILLMVLFLLCLVSVSYAQAGPGPLMLSAHTAAWDRSADVNVTGYYIYWRVQGTTVWVSTQKSVLVAQPVSGVVPAYNLLLLNLANGSYEICATARDAPGNESGPSNIVPFVQYIPVAPANLKNQ